MPKVTVHVRNLVPLDAALVTGTMSKFVTVHFNEGDGAEKVFARAQAMIASEGLVAAEYPNAPPYSIDALHQSDSVVSDNRASSKVFETLFPPPPPDWSKLPDIPAWSKLMADQPA